MPHTNSFNTNSYNNVWNSYNISDERPRTPTWSPPLQPRLRYQDIQDFRVEGVGEWLLETEEFRRWGTGSGGRECDDACYGDPGAGKAFTW